MTKIIDYKIVISEKGNLSSSVMQCVAYGYEPQGGPYIGSYGKICQAMVKREESKKKTTKKRVAKNEY